MNLKIVRRWRIVLLIIESGREMRLCLRMTEPCIVDGGAFGIEIGGKDRALKWRKRDKTVLEQKSVRSPRVQSIWHANYSVGPSQGDLYIYIIIYIYILCVKILWQQHFQSCVSFCSGQRKRVLASRIWARNHDFFHKIWADELPSR